MILAVSNNANALRYSSVEMKKDHNIVLKAVKNSGSSLEYADPQFRKNITIIMQALKEDESCILNVDQQLSNLVKNFDLNLTPEENSFKQDILKRAKISQNKLEAIYQKEQSKKKYKKIKTKYKRRPPNYSAHLIINFIGFSLTPSHIDLSQVETVKMLLNTIRNRINLP